MVVKEVEVVVIVVFVVLIVILMVVGMDVVVVFYFSWWLVVKLAVLELSVRQMFLYSPILREYISFRLSVHVLLYSMHENRTNR